MLRLVLAGESAQSRADELERVGTAWSSSAGTAPTLGAVGNLLKRPESRGGVPAADLRVADVDEVVGLRLEAGAGVVREQQHVPRPLRQLLDPRGGVADVADRRVLEPALVADVAGDEGAAVQADPHPEAVAVVVLAHPLVQYGQARSNQVP